MNTLQIVGDWNIIKGKLTQRWVNLTDEDLYYVEGNEENLIGKIQERTGESRESVEQVLKRSEISELVQLAFPMLVHSKDSVHEH